MERKNFKIGDKVVCIKTLPYSNSFSQGKVFVISGFDQHGNVLSNAKRHRRNKVSPVILEHVEVYFSPLYKVLNE